MPKFRGKNFYGWLSSHKISPSKANLLLYDSIQSTGKCMYKRIKRASGEQTYHLLIYLCGMIKLDDSDHKVHVRATPDACTYMYIYMSFTSGA